MFSARDFRELALKCARWAEETRDVGQREILIELGKQCCDLAQTLAEHEPALGN